MEHDRTSILFDLIRQDPVAGAMQCRERVLSDEAGFQRDRRMRIAEAALVVRVLRTDFDAWTRFLSDPYFDDEKKLKSQDASTYMPFVAWAVMQYHFNPDITNRTKSNRTWKYARATDFHEIEQLPPEKIADEIERAGGIEKLCRRAAQEDPRREQQAMLATGPEAETVHEQADEDAEDAEDAKNPEEITPKLFGHELEPEPEFIQQTMHIDRTKIYELDKASPGDRVHLTVRLMEDEAGKTFWWVESADCIG